VFKLMTAGLKVGGRGREIKAKRDLNISYHCGTEGRQQPVLFLVSDGCSDELAEAACERSISRSIEVSD